jgi:hypothetical protein
MPPGHRHFAFRHSRWLAIRIDEKAATVRKLYVFGLGATCAVRVLSDFAYGTNGHPTDCTSNTSLEVSCYASLCVIALSRGRGATFGSVVWRRAMVVSPRPWLAPIIPCSVIFDGVLACAGCCLSDTLAERRDNGQPYWLLS